MVAKLASYRLIVLLCHDHALDAYYLIGWFLRDQVRSPPMASHQVCSGCELSPSSTFEAHEQARSWPSMYSQPLRSTKAASFAGAHLAFLPVADLIERDMATRSSWRAKSWAADSKFRAQQSKTQRFVSASTMQAKVRVRRHPKGHGGHSNLRGQVPQCGPPGGQTEPPRRPQSQCRFSGRPRRRATRPGRQRDIGAAT